MIVPFVALLLGACVGGNPEIRLTLETPDFFLNRTAVWIDADGEVEHVRYTCFAEVSAHDRRNG